MTEKRILQGECENCGPSQVIDPLPSPFSNPDDGLAFLVERPKTKVILPETDVAGAVAPDSHDVVIGMIRQGLPFVATFKTGPESVHAIFGGLDALSGIEILVGAIRQELQRK